MKWHHVQTVACDTEADRLALPWTSVCGATIRSWPISLLLRWLHITHVLLKERKEIKILNVFVRFGVSSIVFPRWIGTRHQRSVVMSCFLDTINLVKSLKPTQYLKILGRLFGQLFVQNAGEREEKNFSLSESYYERAFRVKRKIGISNGALVHELALRCMFSQSTC